MPDSSIEVVFTCGFCAHETRLTIATQSTVEGQTLACPVCGGELGELSDRGAEDQAPPSREGHEA